MYKTVEVKREEIIDIIEENCKTLATPRDDYWEGAILNNCKYYLIKDGYRNEDTMGYFATGKDNSIYQFYLIDKYNTKSKEIWNFVIKNNNIDKAFVETYDSNYLVLCMDLAKKVDIFSYVYRACEDVHIETSTKNLEVSIACMNEIEAIVEFCKEAMDEDDESWLCAYYMRWIKNHSIYIFKSQGTIIAIGEIRTSHRAKDIAYLGVVVSKKYRNLGLGQYVTSYLKLKSKQLGFSPVSFVDANNIASNKMMSKSGFYAHHRILKINLKDKINL